MEKKQPYMLGLPRGKPTTPPEIVDYIIATGVRLNASDIHIGINQSASIKEPYLLRYRIHGKLQPVKAEFLSGNFKEIISRIKVIADMNTTDPGLPQDGQFQATTTEGGVVLRISTVPCADLEEVVIRIQKGVEKILPLDQLTMSMAMLKKIQALVRQKSGLIVLNGPAGSGKTTTIYSILSSIASAEKKVITAENPVESRIPYVSHIQITPKASFAALARSFMRQDCEVIFIGEIRDAESAEIAIQLAQTGHLVLTTLHTRDSFGVIQRLENFDIHTSYIASTLIASLAQRLVPKLCPSCRVPAPFDEAMIKRFTRILPKNDNSPLFKAGSGCPMCVGGYSGRVPVYELLTVDSEISELIAGKRPRQEILQNVRTKGMLLLPEEMMIRFYAGLTDYESIHSYIFGTEVLGI